MGKNKRRSEPPGGEPEVGSPPVGEGPASKKARLPDGAHTAAEGCAVGGLSKSKLKRMKRKLKEERRRQGGRQGGAASQSAQASPANGEKKGKRAGGLSALQSKFKAKLEGAQFRMLNEMLYTSTGSEALKAFSKEPALFDVYHQGFREQVNKWPRNPLDDMIAWVRRRPQAVVADFGCGEARLAASVENKVHSFDLVARNERITACDIAHVPLPNASVDVAIFCLSLMGTDMMKFVAEGVRVLKPGGLMKIAEVRSRFEGMEGGVERFVQACKALGLECRQMDRGNKMFFMMEFEKRAKDKAGAVAKEGKKAKGKAKGGEGAPQQLPQFAAKACVYKRR